MTVYIDKDVLSYEKYNKLWKWHRATNIRKMNPIRWIHEKIAKFALNIIGWVETLQMQVFELKWDIHIHVNYLLNVFL